MERYVTVDWDSLKPDPGPPAKVRSWRTLARWRDARDTRSWLRYLAQLEVVDLQPVYGITPPSGRCVELPVPWDMVVEEFVRQSLFLPVGDRLLRLTSSEQVCEGPAVLKAPVGFVSRSGAPGQDPARWPSYGSTVGAVDARARWTDAMIATTPRDAQDRAAETMQPLSLLWRPGPGQGRLELRDPMSADLVWSGYARVTRAVRGCPLVAGSPPGQLCRMYGGPWVSRSIVAAGKWSCERTQRLLDAGCDTCGDGAVRLGPFWSGQPIQLAPDERWDRDVRCYGPIPSRYGDVVPTEGRP